MARFVIIFISIIGSALCSKSKFINIDLDNRIPTLTNSEIYSARLPYEKWAPKSEYQLANISKEIEFFIVQVHTLLNDIVMSYGVVPTIANSVNGTNLGLIIYPSYMPTKFYVSSKKYVISDVYVSIHAYFDKAPIPGGCNIEFNVDDAPYLQLTHNSHIINVDAAPPSMNNIKGCTPLSKGATVEFYHMHFSEIDSSIGQYFDNIKKMITVENILKHGSKVSQVYGYGQMRRVFALYPDLGSVYGVIVSNGNYSAAYVPIHTYGCSLSSTCKYPYYSMILIYIAAAIGLFLSISGHYFFNIHIIVMSFISTAIIGYLIFSSSTSFTSDEILNLSMACATIGSVCWLMIWYCYTIPTTIILLDSFCFGVITASVTYYALPDIRWFFEVNMNFWWGFVLVIILCQLILLTIGRHSIMLASAVLGSFLIILPMDVAIGSYLRYIIINIIRRASVDNFNYAVIDPPYQWKDFATTFAWFFLTLLGCKLQISIIRSTGPFPMTTTFGWPSFFSFLRVTQRNNNEQTRLLANAQPVYSAIPSAPPVSTIPTAQPHNVLIW